MIDVDHQEKLLTTKDAAELLDVSVKTIRTLVRHGLIHSLKLGHQSFFRHEDLGAFIMGPFVRIRG